MPSYPRPSFSSRARAALASAMLASGLLVAAGGPASAATASIWADMDNCRAKVTDLGTGVQVNIRLLRADGSVRMQINRTTDGSGQVTLNCMGTMKPGERIVARRWDAATSTFKPLLTFNLPAVPVTMDRVADTLTVGGFANGELNLFLYTCAAPGHLTCSAKGYTTTLPADGSAAAIDITEDLTGSNFVEVNLIRGPFQLTFLVDAPHLEVTPGSSKVAGTGTGPKVKAAVTLKTAASVTKGKGSATTGLLRNRFTATLKRPDGSAIKVTKGMKVSSSVASDARLTLPASFAITIDPDTKVLHAPCVPNAPWGMEVLDADGLRQGTRSGVAGTDGRTEEDVSSVIGSGHHIVIRCATGAGDWYTLTTGAL